ncbi:MAG: gamma carbonic anhydrase family protein [Ignavibacteria bacterium]|jgi:carbonic anhydrase/acetyltransferase-like protein (isoleucine patch superfamily)|nr:gamma carbonic anhydrase family protein [Ignavibacteria bacterium]MCU7501550.1 gamma carbonic anhydrase family protein [Ignavibacteria bacterium]MCU7517087.1 gamma carbonic anhydrase family protein [Ignavibacteria bacterium]
MDEKIYGFKEFLPQVHSTACLFPGVRVIGRVEIGEDVSIWYNSVLRGDVNFIKIGEKTNIQDLSVLHVTRNNPLIIGKSVTIGHAVKLHGCTLEDLCLVGIGSVVLDGALISQNSIVAAGAVVTPGFVVPSGTLVAGVPAKVVRSLKEKEIEGISLSARNYCLYARQSMTEE